MEKGFAERFAKEWVAACSHDLERILAHYDGDFEMSSPIITALVGEPSGRQRGKTAVGAYWDDPRRHGDAFPHPCCTLHWQPTTLRPHE
jgi:hypothetical protein